MGHGAAWAAPGVVVGGAKETGRPEHEVGLALGRRQGRDPLEEGVVSSDESAHVLVERRVAARLTLTEAGVGLPVVVLQPRHGGNIPARSLGATQHPVVRSLTHCEPPSSASSCASHRASAQHR